MQSIEEYKAAMARMREVEQELFVYEYRNKALDELMNLVRWDDIYKQLKKAEKARINYYIKWLKYGDSLGFTKSRIEPLDAAASQCLRLYEKELNSRWIVVNCETGLAWSRYFAPSWDKPKMGFLFIREKEAWDWARKFSKATKTPHKARIIDASSRLKRSKF